MRALLGILILCGCTKPQGLSGTWYALENNDTAWVTFGAVMTVEYKRGLTETTYAETDSLTLDRGVMLFPEGTYGLVFSTDQVIVSGPITTILHR